MRLSYLGHAGFVIEHSGLRILIDPWFSSAFFQSWFPYPDNRFLMDRVLEMEFHYLYLSHIHEDHFDRDFLKQVDKRIPVICPNFRSRSEARQLKELGFTDVTRLDHGATIALGPDISATMLLDMSQKEDSALFVEVPGCRFLDLNDCHPAFNQLPRNIDVLAAQYSGAMWYPNCYDYAPDLLRQKVQKVREDLVDTVSRYCLATDARWYIPSAGPACFLDPELAHLNDRDETIFAAWEDVEPLFSSLCDTEVVRIGPGDTVDLDPAPTIGSFEGEARAGDDLEAYARRRRPEWQAFHAAAVREITTEEVRAYFCDLVDRNIHIARTLIRRFSIECDGQVWVIELNGERPPRVTQSQQPLAEGYAFSVPPPILRAIIDHVSGWEEALLSMRIALHREPDVFDSLLLGLLRYGNHPVQTRQMLRQGESTETFERDGFRMQRFCPHAGEDLRYATVTDGVLECPRHHWRWDLTTGSCVSGGALPLKVERVRSSAGDARSGQ